MIAYRYRFVEEREIRSEEEIRIETVSTKFNFSNYEFCLYFSYIYFFLKKFISIINLNFSFSIFIVSVLLKVTFGGYVAVIDSFRELRFGEDKVRLLNGIFARYVRFCATDSR